MIKNSPNIPNRITPEYSGIFVDVYKWHDTNHGIDVEVSKFTPGVVALAFDHTGAVIILKEKLLSGREVFSLPGGKVEGELDPAIAVRRELEEETGFSSSHPPIEIFSFSNSSTIEKFTSGYVLKNCLKHKSQKLDQTENIIVELVSFKEFLSLAAGDRFRNLEIQAFLYRVQNNGELRSRFNAMLPPQVDY